VCKQIIECINQVVAMSSRAREIRGPVIRGDIVGRVGKSARGIMWVADEGIVCGTMRCYAGDYVMGMRGVDEKGVGGGENSSTEFPCPGTGTAS